MTLVIDWQERCRPTGVSKSCVIFFSLKDVLLLLSKE